MHNAWLRFGCFITGYNYRILTACSEVAAKTVKRYASAMVIVGILWSFIGYTFAERYLHAGFWGSIAGAVILLAIIVQVERQIILSINPSKFLYWMRGFIAVTMALIGSIIIDQIILKEDIEVKKLLVIDEEVSRLMPIKATELQQQMNALDSTIESKEAERKRIQDDILQNPTIPTVTTATVPMTVPTTTVDSTGRSVTTNRIVQSSSVTKSAIANPNIPVLDQLNSTLQSLRMQKASKDSVMLALRPTLTAQLLERKGFLDELKVMVRLISESWVALVVWLLWIFIILGIELFILISKVGEKPNDYDAMIRHQMNMHMKMLEVMGRGGG